MPSNSLRKRFATALVLGAVVMHVVASEYRLRPGRGGDGGLAGGPLCGIFVSPAGVDTAGGGLTPADPVRTIQFGINRAVATGTLCVFVQSGTYNEVVRLSNDVHVRGGYNVAWQSASYQTSGHTVTINGALDVSSNRYAAVIAENITVAASISNLVINGPNASGTIGGSGRSSYGVYLHNAAPISLADLQINAGNGAEGATGSAGLDAVIVSAQSYMNGGAGGSAHEENFACNIDDRGAAGSAGTNSCSQSPSSSNMNAGAGGRGGTMDTSCNCTFGCVCSNCTATAGESGLNAGVWAVGLYGIGGPGGAANNVNSPGGNGLDGRIANGAAGTGGSGGVIMSFDWFSNAGGNGSTGQNGGGGGGGGGSGGNDAGIDSWGAGGGGGGAGGCAARGGGGGGGGGGGSFGIFAIDSSFAAFNITINRGVAGSGGAGGVGGRGQSGGLGGPGGLADGDSPHGGAGGDGGHGGHGGGGGGGAGGLAAGIFRCNSPATLTNVAYSGGAGGTGGAGGLSAPFAPPADDDGFDGAPGAGGTLQATFTPATCGAGGSGPSLSLGSCDATPCVNLCPADIAPIGAADGIVNVNDLLAVITAWGSCPIPCPPRCAADIAPVPSGDCSVNVNDLLAVITSWGACP